MISVRIPCTKSFLCDQYHIHGDSMWRKTLNVCQTVKTSAVWRIRSPTLPNFWLMPVRMESPKGSQYWELIIPTRLHLLTDTKTRIREWLQESIHVVQAPQICWHNFERRNRVSWSYTKFPKFLRNFGIVETVSLRSVREIKGLFPQHLGN